ncbi:ribosome-inactivating family protein [Streptomyces sp. NPDC052682]|uniref:ribosome-inactivating family protein n=1 Tax=Streptomyces sp. NPDC052682 TaxID=3154954 RepID=UPI0034408019
MPTSVLAAVALSVLLGFLVIVLHWVDSRRPDSTEPAPAQQIDLPRLRWHIDRGSGAYLTMLGQLRDLAEASDSTESPGFADLVISSDNQAPTVHATVRLSDFTVVRFSSSGTSHDFALNLTSDVPHQDDAGDDDWFLGKEGYDALARVADQALTAVNLSRSGLEDSLWDLGIRGTDRTAQARGILRYSIAITGASRFRPVADRIASGMDNGSDVFVTAQQVGLMRT